MNGKCKFSVKDAPILPRLSPCCVLCCPAVYAISACTPPRLPSCQDSKRVAHEQVLYDCMAHGNNQQRPTHYTSPLLTRKLPSLTLKSSNCGTFQILQHASYQISNRTSPFMPTLSERAPSLLSLWNRWWNWAGCSPWMRRTGEPQHNSAGTFPNHEWAKPVQEGSRIL